MSEPVKAPGVATSSNEREHWPSGCMTSLVVGVVVSVALVLMGERQGLSPGVLLLATPGGAVATVALLLALGERRWEELLSAGYFVSFVSAVPVSILVGLYWLSEMSSD